jgi:hypothetical protein
MELHTLVEEDEEEEEKEDERDDSVTASGPVEISQADATVGSVVVTASTPTLPSRHRPANLNLRPLSLTKENVIGLGSLPTPASPNYKPGLKSLTLASAPISTNSDTNNSLMTTNINRRQSLTISPVTPPVTHPPRRPSLNLDFEANLRSSASLPFSTDTESAKRRASISYRCSTDVAYGQFTLPTPELTPTLQRHRSISSNSTGVSEWSLSETEQHFLYQAHATLVQRISDLERALAVSRSRPRSASCASDTSSRSSISSDHAHLEEPSDEMLQLIADLKAERDELNKDVEGWRVRVSDLDRQVGLLARRVDLERREAWVARERSGLLEFEKKGLEQRLQAKVFELQEVLEKYKNVEIECAETKQECEGLKVDLQEKKEVEVECGKLRLALAEEKKKREELESSSKGAGILNTSTPAAFDAFVVDRPPSYSKSIGKKNLGFQSIDSETTDVDVVDQLRTHLKSVTEEHEFSDEEADELANYEDEHDDDLINQGSSISSFDEAIRLRIEISAPSPVSSPENVKPRVADGATGHQRHHSLSKTWTFPKDVQVSLPATREVDQFFGCFEDLDDTCSLDDIAHLPISDDNGRGLFSRSLLQSDDDESPPFLLPKNVGYELPEERPALDVVVEEEEEDDKKGIDEDVDEFAGEVVDGGIIFKFSPPDDSDASSELLTPSPGLTKQDLHIFETPDGDEDEDELSFGGSQAMVPITPPPKSSNKKSNSPTPSSIPRAIALRTYTPTKLTPSTGLISERSSSDAFTTPPSKRGGTMPTFIPQFRSRTVSPVTPAAKSVAPASGRQTQRGNNISASNPAVNSSQGPTSSSMPQSQFHSMSMSD